MILNDFETLFYQELKQDFFCCLMNVRILAKFLGFLLFQPYYGVETTSQVITTETLKIRNRVSVNLLLWNNMHTSKDSNMCCGIQIFQTLNV